MDDDAGESDGDDSAGRPGGGDPVCGAETTTTGRPCQFPVESPDDRCPMHPPDGSGPPEGHGSGTTSHSMGDGTGDIREKLSDPPKPAMEHGVSAVDDDPRGTLQWLEDNDPAGYDWIIAKWRSYLADAPFGPETSKADEVLHACLMLYAVRGARHKQVTQGLVEQRALTDDDGDLVTDPDTGEPFTVSHELSTNLPANRIAREARSILKDHGILDDPESQKADAMGWGQAAKQVAKEVDSDVQDVHHEDADGDGPDARGERQR